MSRVLVADDSSLFLDTLSDIVRATPGLSLAGVARDGREAVAKTAALRPDVVVMDVLMPELDGLAATEQIMADTPTPILIVSADPRSRTGALSIEALARGALEVMTKPERLPLDARTIERLASRIELLARVPVVRHVRGRRPRWAERTVPSPAVNERPRLVGIAASTGGPQALGQLLGDLPEGFGAALVVVQHIGEAFVEALCRWLDGSTALTVRPVEAGVRLTPGDVWLAPTGRHVEVRSGGRLALVSPRDGDVHCPSGDRLFHSIAESLPSTSVGVQLTGMGRDGAAGLAALRAAGGVTIAQDASSSVVDGMPRAARESGAAGHVLPLHQIAPFLCELVGERNERGHPRDAG